MQMGMKVKILSPGVENVEEADLGAEVTGIAGDGEQGFRSSTEENVEDRFRAVKSKSGNLFRQGEDDVKILHGQKLRFAGFEPFGASQRLALGTVPVTTRVVADPRMTALAAFVDMTAQGWRAASRDGVHGPSLLARKGIHPRKIGLSKNVGQFKGWPWHRAGSVLRFGLRFLSKTSVE